MDGTRRWRVGLFGGAFDPPHWAHYALAEAALRQLKLDALHILPTGQAVHKQRRYTAADHRLAMCQAAFADLGPQVQIDDREIRRTGPSYTADTLDELALVYPHAELFLMLGADQLLAFKTWHRWPDIVAHARLVVAQRPTPASPADTSGPKQGPDLSTVDLPYQLLDLPPKPLSATAVRTLLEGACRPPPELDALVPAGVARYISEHHLYQTPA